MKNQFYIALALLLACTYGSAQVKIGDNPNTINANSLLELESTNKGFLPPRVALNSISSVSPLTGTVPSGMLVFSSGGTVPDGYYYWNGTQWMLLASSQTNIVAKTADATLLKSENFILASNDITLTLPTITSADNGLTITIKNGGTHTDLITVVGNGGALLDGAPQIALPRWFSLTVVAKDSAWYFKERTMLSANTMEVSPFAPWQTLEEAIEFLDLHMWGPTVIKIGSGEFELSSTLTINLPFPLTFQGTSYGTTTIAAASGLENKPMFRCVSDCFFKMLEFDATSLSGYGTQPGEDAIRLLGDSTYNEVKDCMFDGFYNTILDSNNAELWVFETDIYNAHNNGILVHSAVAGTTIKVAETDFIGCKRGVNLDKGSLTTIQLASGGYYNTGANDTAIVYRASTFSSFTSLSIAGNSWNNIGKYVEGFDFTRSDARDANAILESNAGMGDKKPICYVNVTNNATATTLTSNGSWYKVNWTTTSSTATKWTVGNNRITYQPVNRRDAFVTISGNIQVSNSAAVVNIGIVKNPSGTSATSASVVRYGETTLRPGVANQPVQFSTVIYLPNIGANDYFELWCNSATSGINITIQDTQWLVKAE